MSREMVLVLLVVLVLWWTSDVSADAPAQGAPTHARATNEGMGPNKWWAPCPPGYVQIPPFGECLPPNNSGTPIVIY